MPDSPHPTRIRIYSHLTASHFLHVEDALHIDKLRLFVGTYQPGAGMTAGTHAFVDTADAWVILDALARGEPDFHHQEYKGTAPQHGRPAVSRMLSIATKDEQVTIALQTGPGKATPTGAITPHGRPDVTVDVVFPLYEARRLGAVVLAYLQAWEVLRMLCYHPLATGQEGVGRPLPYLLVPATSDRGMPVNAAGSDERGSSQTHPPQPAGVKALVSKRPPTGKVARPLRYGDGRLVDAQNVTEVQTFQRYTAEKQTVPLSKADLLAYYRQRTQVPAG